MKQTIGNACGTVAIIHSIANNTDVLELGKDQIIYTPWRGTFIRPSDIINVMVQFCPFDFRWHPVA